MHPLARLIPSARLHRKATRERLHLTNEIDLMKTIPLSILRRGFGLVLLLASPWLGLAQTNPPTAQAAGAAPPPAAPAKLSAADLEKLLMPIALYPDALIATMLPASVYPLEIVQAARFLADTNNAAKIDEQPWDDSVKAIAKIPAALKKMNDDLQWTIQLGEVFLNQDKEVMDMIQSLRMKAQKGGTLRTTEQQIVVVTNTVVETKVEQQVVVVTNTIVQIQPANPQVVYVPTYPPTVYYPPPAYVYDPYAPLVTFAAGVAVGAIIANNCDWHHGGCYWGGGNVDVDVDIDRNVNRNRNTNVNRDRASASQRKWQPDQSRMSRSGAPGWGSGGGAGGAGGARASAQPAGGARPSTGAGARPSTGAVGNRPSAGTPSAGGPGTGARTTSNFQQPSANRPTQSPAASARPTQSSSSFNRPSAQSSSAFGGVGGGSSARSDASRGAASRSGGFSGGGGGGRGGGGRGGGGRR
jgi:uncharacterized protein DUF3300